MKIGDLCTYAPKSAIKAGEAVPEGAYMFFTSSSDESKRYSEYQLDCEGIIMGTGGNATLHYYNGKFATSTDCVVLIPNDTIRCKYLYYFFLCNMAVLESGFKGAGLKHTNKNYINSIDLSVIPSLEEQDDVIEVLNKVQSIIAGRKKELSKLDDLIKARFVELFGKCEGKRKLSEYSELITKGASPRWQGVEYSDNEEGTLFVTSENVREGYIDYSKKKYLPNEINAILPRSVLKRNDVLINIVNASIGRAAIYDSDALANINQAVALVRLKPNSLNLRFLLAFLNSDEAIRAYDYMKVGGDKANLSLKNISDLLIPVADISLQNQFAEFVKQVDKSKVVVQAALDKAQLLFDSLMQEYFG